MGLFDKVFDSVKVPDITKCCQPYIGDIILKLLSVKFDQPGQMMGIPLSELFDIRRVH